MILFIHLYKYYFQTCNEKKIQYRKYILAMFFHPKSTHICVTKWNLVYISIIYFKYLVNGNITHDGVIEVKSKFKLSNNGCLLNIHLKIFLQMTSKNTNNMCMCWIGAIQSSNGKYWEDFGPHCESFKSPTWCLMESCRNCHPMCGTKIYL